MGMVPRINTSLILTAKPCLGVPRMSTDQDAMRELFKNKTIDDGVPARGKVTALCLTWQRRRNLAVPPFGQARSFVWLSK